MSEMLGGFFWSGNSPLGIEMPAHHFAAILHFDGEIAVESPIHNSVVTHGPIAI